jgi:phenylalanyl-tRNA synthetase alpha chain
MGFKEMKTNQFVENSFWNFDALFQPQQHPARDAHDTFFVSHPASSQQIPEDYMKTVKRMHEHGDESSIGWRYNWSEEETRKNILRTHTTSVSSRTLYQLAREQNFQPGLLRPFILFLCLNLVFESRQILFNRSCVSQ